MPDLGPSRRSFVMGACALAAGAAVGGVACAFSSGSANDALRPPGSVSEKDFMALCIRCERCISVCPEDVLEPIGIEGGWKVRTPRLSFLEGSCTFCDLCREVCPTAAVRKVDPYRPDLGRIGVAVVWEDRCLAYTQAGSCGICVDACPYHAMSFDDERHPVVDDSLCNGCGECERICPANVLTSFSGGLARGIEILTEEEFEKRRDAV